MIQKRYAVTIFCLDHQERVIDKTSLILKEENGQEEIDIEINIHLDIKKKELVKVHFFDEEKGSYTDLDFKSLGKAAQKVGLPLDELILACEIPVLILEVSEDFETYRDWSVDDDRWISVYGKKREPVDLSSLHAFRMQVRKIYKKMQADDTSNRRTENIKKIRHFTRWEEIPDELISKLAWEIFRVQLTSSPSKAAETK